MADTAARLALVARRNEVLRFTIVVAGIDMTGVAMSMQVRLARGTPGAPLIQLATVATASAEGLKFDSVAVKDGVPTSVIKGRINQSTMSDATKVPYAGEQGADTVLAYAMQWTLNGDANTRLEGAFIVRDTAYGSDNAPVTRPVGYGSAPTAVAGGSGTLMFGDQLITVVIDGADLVGAQVVLAGASAARAEAAVTASGANASRAEAGAANAQVIADRLVITSRQFYGGVTNRFAYGVIDQYGRPRGGVLNNGDVWAQQIAGPASRNGYAFVVRDGYGKPAFAVDANGVIWTKNGILGTGANTTAERTALVRPDAVRTWRTKAYALNHAPAIRAAVLLLGDSQWVPDIGRSNVFLAQYLHDKYGYGGPGFVAVGAANASGTDIVLAKTGNTTAVGGVSWSPSGIGLVMQTAATFSFTYNLAKSITFARLLHGGGGSISYRWNGGPWVAIAANSAAGFLDIPNIPGGGFTLDVRNDDAISLNLAGVVLMCADGCVMHNAAIGGYSTGSYLGLNQAEYRATIARLGGYDAAVIGLAGNDEAQNVTVVQFDINAGALIDLVRADVPGCDVVWVFRPQIPRNGTVPDRVDLYAAQFRATTAAAKSIACFDALPWFGASFSEFNYTGTKRQWLRPDNLHVNDLGAAVLALGPANLLLAN